MPLAPEELIKSGAVRIGDTIYAQNEKNKLFTFDLNTKKWEVCDGMDIENHQKYIGAKYVSSSISQESANIEHGGDEPTAINSAVDN